MFNVYNTQHNVLLMHKKNSPVCYKSFLLEIYLVSFNIFKRSVRLVWSGLLWFDLLKSACELSYQQQQHQLKALIRCSIYSTKSKVLLFFCLFYLSTILFKFYIIIIIELFTILSLAIIYKIWAVASEINKKKLKLFQSEDKAKIRRRKSFEFF